MSLAEPQIPDGGQHDEDGLEFNRSTLLGEWDELFEGLLRQRLHEDRLDPVADYMAQLRAHMNRGAELACNRLRDVADVLQLIPHKTAGAASEELRAQGETA